MEVTWSFLVLLCALHLTLTGVLAKHIDHRNLFTQRMCCKRQSHFVYIGQDISGSPVSVDMGTCRSHCGGASRPPHETGQQDYSKYSSMLEFLRSKKTGARGPAAAERAEPPHQLLHQRPSCGANQVCAPTAMRVERVLLLEGPREVEVVEECHCEVKLSQCLRVPALRTYYSETPYETVVDVGGCSRSKGSPEGFSCVPTKFDSALVETPNKVDLIQTVVTCELKESCYRVPYVEYYYEIVHHADGVKEERLKHGILNTRAAIPFAMPLSHIAFVTELRGNGGFEFAARRLMKYLHSSDRRGRRQLIKLTRRPVAGTARPGVKDFRMCGVIIHAQPAAIHIADWQVSIQ
ncbi:hypothetical protein F2P81_000361 [Scophthalmus maximus]|uniref:Uncharacterized protein n=1 Tax=Scophthalmus maximus TaxID=52904 RepID=A0A6A4TQT7_SCOMX|nr:hypothetical protein F2P81_000361 [Scophthalmus maximus]